MPKYLIIRFSSIGDIVLTTPVARALKEQAGAEVHYLTKASFQSVLKANPHVDRIHTIRKEVKEVLPQLRAERFDGIIDLHNNLRSRQVRLGLFSVPARGFNKLNLEKWLMVRLKINRLPKVHIVDRYLKAVAHLGVKDDGKGLDYFIPPADELDAGVFIRSRGLDLVSNPDKMPPEASYTAFVVGAAHATMRRKDRIRSSRPATGHAPSARRKSFCVLTSINTQGNCRPLIFDPIPQFPYSRRLPEFREEPNEAAEMQED